MKGDMIWEKTAVNTVVIFAYLPMVGDVRRCKLPLWSYFFNQPQSRNLAWKHSSKVIWGKSG